MANMYYPYDNGTVGPTGPEGPQGPAGPAGTNGVVQSVNGKSAQAVVLNAADVGAFPSTGGLVNGGIKANGNAGTYRTLALSTAGSDRWYIQADNTAEAGSAAGSDLVITSRSDTGAFQGHAMYAKRSSGATSFGSTVLHGGAQVTVNGAIGVRDRASDPGTVSGGVFLYSKGGVPYFKNADGTSFQVQPLSYPVSSVNGQTGNVSLGAPDVGALPSNADATLNAARLKVNAAAGTFRMLGFQTAGVDRWIFGTDNEAEAGADAGTNVRLTARKDDGSYASTPLHIKRSNGQISLGTESKHGSATVTTGGAIGVKDIAADPDTAAGGVTLYSKGGLPYIKQGDGTVFKVGSGGGGTGGAVDSVNGKTGIVELTADDVNALPEAGGTLTGPLNITPSAGSGLTVYGGSDASTYFRVTEAGHPYSNSLRPTFYNLGVGDTTTDFAGGKFVLAMKDRNVAPSVTPSNGLVMFADGGRLKVLQSDGTTVTVGDQAVLSVNGQTGAVSVDLDDLGGLPYAEKAAANGVASLDSAKRVPVAQLPDAATPGGFIPEDLGLKAWAGDPANCRSGFRDGGTGRGRMAAVVVRQPTTVSKIVWHFLGYAGGLKTGSWAGIYNTAGALVRGTGDLSTAAYEPKEQHGTGGGCSSSNLTSSVTLAPGVYYVAWRFVYTASPADGPLLMAFESSDVSATLYGLSAVRRFGAFSTSSTSAPSSVSGWETDPIRFWAALA
ncbi:hypothetical protein [Streptomyces sp. NPDC055793]